MWCYEGE
jgi:hypothetical protein